VCEPSSMVGKIQTGFTRLSSLRKTDEAMWLDAFSLILVKPVNPV
jgi:hypothetical protein